MLNGTCNDLLSTFPVAQVRKHSKMAATSVPFSNLRSHKMLIAVNEEPCPDCGPGCSPTVELTSQCTDKCVIACCPDEQAHCDLDCDHTTDCFDCHSFDNFLQCYPTSDPKHHSDNTAISWDPSLEAFFCSCGVDGSQQNSNNFQIEPAPPSYLPDFSQPSYPSNEQQYLFNPTPNIACMWGDCQASFTTMEELVGHVNGHHLRLPDTTPVPDNPLSCLWGNCNLTAESIPGPSSGSQFDLCIDLLANHLMQDHLGVPPSPVAPQQDAQMPASIPPLETSSEEPSVASSPSDHTDHTCSGSHPCLWESCGESFSSCDDLTTHLSLVHVGSGKAQYDCHWADCTRHGDNGFSSKQKISRHLQMHTGHRPFQCKVCQQNFSEAATLQQHMRRHTQEKPYVCDHPGCGKRFAITGALTIHKRVHNGDKPFKCTYCDRAFAESSNLSKHLRTHTGAKPYPCTHPDCGKHFARPDQLTRHMSVHRKKKSV
ncbi:hypothetical protein C8J56DRAFT_953425 [Mycena floridula]|nr:hypothetical protein C8J56DRAFT_953425 [Mycena floridula]